MIILIDTREKGHRYIIDQFDKKGIAWRSQKLDFCDYSFEVDGVSFEKKCAIERKGLSEITQNLTKHKTRFQREFERAKGCKVYVMIEGCSYDDLYAHNYRSMLSPKDFDSRIKTWQYRYMFILNFVQKENVVNYILKTFNNYYFTGLD